MLEAAEQKIYAIRRGRSAQGMVTVGMVLQRRDEPAGGAVRQRRPDRCRACPPACPPWTPRSTALNKSDLLLLAARPGMGKTSMALNVALSAAQRVRQDRGHLLPGNVQGAAGHPPHRQRGPGGEHRALITGNLRESDWQRIAEAASALSRMDIRIDDNPLLTVADMNAKCRRLENLGLVVIDYLQLMTSAGGKGYSGENRQQAVSDISRMLKIMAKELQVPVLCLSQLSRANEKREDKRPMLSDLRESGAIEQDADIVMFLYRDDYYNSDAEKRNVAECIVAKNRHGETGKVELRWMPEYTAFGTLETRYDEDE